MILFNSEKCDALSINYVNTASDLIYIDLIGWRMTARLERFLQNGII